MESIQSKALKLFARLAKINKIWTLEGADLQAAIAQKQKKLATPSKKMTEDFLVHYDTSLSFPFYKISQKQKASQKSLIYLAGGGFVLPMSELHWSYIENIMRSLDIEIYVPIYPLALEFSFKDMSEFLVDFYRSLDVDFSNLTIMGDSAGGTLALSLAQSIQKHNLKNPKQIIVISPLVRFDFSNPQIQIAQKSDFISATKALGQIGEWVAIGSSLNDSLISPYYGNFKDTSPIHIFSGTADITNPDTRTMVEQNPTDFNYYEYNKMPHIFPLFPLPEGKSASNIIKSLL